MKKFYILQSATHYPNLWESSHIKACLVFAQGRRKYYPLSNIKKYSGGYNYGKTDDINALELEIEKY